MQDDLGLPAHPTEVAFLGFAERATAVQEGTTPFNKWNLLGLKQTLLTFLVPLSLGGLKWAVALRLGSEAAIELRIKSESGENIGGINIALQPAIAGNPAEENAPAPSFAMTAVDPRAWVVMLFEPPPGIYILQPGYYSVAKVRPDGSESNIGGFNVLLLEAPPLDADRIAAIRSDPFGSKAIRIELGCKKCSTKVRAFASLERKPEADGYSWYADLPEQITCSCGSTTFDLRSIKRNLHALLGHPISSAPQEVRTPLYEQSALQEVRLKFNRLLDRSPSEETLQQFIQDNPILLHQFPAEKLFFKPAILNLFKADFAILTSQKELILIEIENTKTRLMKKNGDAAAPLGHSMDQVRNWLHVVDEHRLAVLQGLGIDRVSSVRGVVIAGRDALYNREHLRRLKGVDWGRIGFLTFDDLAFSLAALADRMTKL